MYNILQGMGKADLLKEVCWDQIYRLDQGPVRIGLFVKQLLDVYLEHGEFESEEQRHYFNYKEWAHYPKWWDEEIEYMEDYYKILEGSSRQWDSIKKRHLIYIPFGIIYELNIERANPEWYRTSGLEDYMGKVDFIDFENRKLITVKATKYDRRHQLVNDIREYWKDTPAKDFEIVFVFKNTSEWTAFSGAIAPGNSNYVRDIEYERWENSYKNKHIEQLIEKLGR